MTLFSNILSIDNRHNRHIQNGHIFSPTYISSTQQFGINILTFCSYKTGPSGKIISILSEKKSL